MTISMSQIQTIRQLKKEGESITGISRKVGVSRDTVYKYLEKDDFSFAMPVKDVRCENKKRRLMRRAAFPVIKSLDDLDFTEIVMPESYSKEEMIGLGFIERAQDFVFYGKTGRGKTHLAIALGIAAINAGYEVLFFSTASLVRRLVGALSDSTLESLLKDIRRADIVILDEFGYIPLDVDGARLLFQVISEAYESKSLILTTNIEFSKWSSIFADEKLAAAAVDRIVHHGRLIEFNGPSRRMDASLMLGKGED